MKKTTIIASLLFPMYVLSQTYINISPAFVSDEQKTFTWYINGLLLHYDDFPITVYSKDDCIDSIVFVYLYSDHLKYDTLLTKFHDNSQLLLIPDNNGSFDIVQLNKNIRSVNKVKFIINNCAADTVLCCCYRVATLTGHVSIGSGISGWMNAWKNQYSSNTIQISIYDANGISYHSINKNESLLFGDKHCSIVEWDVSQQSALKHLVSLKLRLFGHDKAFVIYDCPTGRSSVRIMNKR